MQEPRIGIEGRYLEEMGRKRAGFPGRFSWDCGCQQYGYAALGKDDRPKVRSYKFFPCESHKLPLRDYDPVYGDQEKAK